MIEKIIYRTIDGKVFDHLEDANKHEVDIIVDSFELENIILAIKRMCTNIDYCDVCPLYNTKNWYNCKE